MGGANDHPSPLEFQYRLRWFILGKHSAEVFRQNKNTEENHEPCLLQPLEMPSKFCLTGSVLSNFANNFNVNPCNEFDEDNMINHEFIDPEYSEIGHPEAEGA
jgi:hypothetical protein